MNKVLVILFLLFSKNTVAQEEWEYLTKGSLGKSSIYINNESIIKKEEYVYLWILLNHIKRNKSGYLSGGMYLQFNCKWYKYKSLYHTFHLESMGRDNVRIYNSTNTEWKPIFTGNKSAIIFDRICR